MLKQDSRAENPGAHKTIGIILFPIIAIAIATIGIIMFSEDADASSFWHRSDFFWYRLIWIELILAFGFYGIINGVLPQLLQKRQQTGAGYIGMAGAISQATILSFFVWFISIWLPDERFYFSLEISCQVVIVVVCLIKFFLLMTAQKLQNDGMELLPQNVRTPDELCVFLEICEKQPSLDKDIVKRIKACKEKIKYSLPRVGNISQSEKYRVVSQKVQDFHDKMMTGDRDNLPEELSMIDGKLQEVIAECKK